MDQGKQETWFSSPFFKKQPQSSTELASYGQPVT
jgi:hypothetical protein